MKLYLARKSNGLYMLTKLEPVCTNIVHTDHVDVFVRPGDPINFQGLCPFSVHALFGVELEPGGACTSRCGVRNSARQRQRGPCPRETPECR
jgi:hypothetical protein